MRDVREVMRLHRDGCVPMREISRMHGLARSTVRDMIVRFERSGLAWLIPSEISDTDVEQRLYGAAGVKPGRRKLPEPDWSMVAREMPEEHFRRGNNPTVGAKSGEAMRALKLIVAQQ